MTSKAFRFCPYWIFLFCYGLVTVVGLIPGLLYGNEMGYWLLGFWLILPWSALLCTCAATFFRLFIRFCRLQPVCGQSGFPMSPSARRSFRRASATG